MKWLEVESRVGSGARVCDLDAIQHQKLEALGCCSLCGQGLAPLSPLTPLGPPPSVTVKSDGEHHQVEFPDIPPFLRFTGNTLYFSNKSSKCILK